MKMVAAAKLRKAQNRIIEARPYASKMKEVVGRLVKNTSGDNVLLRNSEDVNQVLLIVIGSDRGLCGGFNNNLFKLVEDEVKKKYSEHKKSGRLSLICLGRKTVKYFSKRNYKLEAEFPGFFEELKFHEAMEIMKHVIAEFEDGQFDEVKLAYNEFKSVIAQNRIVESVLPIDPQSLIGDEDSDSGKSEYIYEPGMDGILERLLPLHLNLQLWKAILESNAAEQGARMTSMDNATENAKELQEDLQLEYNRARQSAITTEISEIISGAQALQEA